MGIKAAKDIMSKPIMIRNDKSVQEAINEMKKNNLKKIIIVDENDDLVGVTASWRLRLADNLDMTIKDAIATKKTLIYAKGNEIPKVSQDEDIIDVSHNLMDKDTLIVKDKSAKIVGIITRYDLSKLKYWFSHDYIGSESFYF